MKNGQLVSRMRLKALNSVLLSRTSYFDSGGKLYSGDRDMDTILGYNKNPTYADFFYLYQRQHIAGRIVEAPAQATWSKLPEIIGGKKLKSDWTLLEQNLKVRSKISRADKLAGIGSYSVLILGFNDGLSVDKPVTDNLRGVKDLLYLAPYSEASATIDSIITDPKNPRFGRPEFYRIQTTLGTNEKKTSIETKYHWTRVIHVAEGLLENELFGEPRLLRVANLFADLSKVVGGSAEFFWRIADRGMQFDLDKDVELDPDDEEALDDEIEDYMHNLQRFVRTRGVTAKVLGSETADPRGSYTPIIALISGATGIPQRILTGSERGQLASSQDRASWNERINERQALFAEPMILRPLIDRLITYGVLSGKFNYEIEWPEAAPQTAEEKSVIANRLASAALNISKHFVVGKPVISAEEFRTSIGLEGPPPKPVKLPKETPKGTSEPPLGKKDADKVRDAKTTN